MRTRIKKLLVYAPRFLRVGILHIYEWIYRITSLVWEKKNYPLLKTPTTIPHKHATQKTKKNILFYHISGLSSGGTEKFIQGLARHINRDTYNVFFMYSPQARGLGAVPDIQARLSYISEKPLELISFSYDKLENPFPHYVQGMNPHIKDIINEKSIDLLVIPCSGYTEYPLNTISNIPIVTLNIFGAPTVQKNIRSQICISHEVAQKILPYAPKNTVEVLYIPSEGPDEEAPERGRALRQSLQIPDSHIVFGRIGRADDNIFDPIGLKAFARAVKKNPAMHYMIMSSPPIAKELVKNEHIPNVHFIPASASEKDVWTFHAAIDALAHFRSDGESCGLNIIESMLAGKPIITHRSRQWNAHTEYLDPAFSRIANIDDDIAYENHLIEFAQLFETGKLVQMGQAARTRAQPFLYKNSIQTFERIIENIA